MTESDTRAPRANSLGDPCPAWCVTDHGAPIIPGIPGLGAMDMHYSLPMGDGEPSVRVIQAARLARPQVIIRMPHADVNVSITLELEHAELPGTAALGERLAAQLATAASIAREEW